MQIKKQQLELYMEQWTGSKLGKEYGKAVFCHPAYYAEYIMQTAKLVETQLESRLPGEISLTWDMKMTPPLWKKAEGTKENVDESETGEWKRWLKTQHSTN